MTPFSFLSELRARPYIGILRGISFEQIPGIATACKKASLPFLEITMNTIGAVDLIRALRHECKPLGILVGAGTVRTLDDLNRSLDAGAEFVVSPSLSLPVVKECLKREIPCLPGALTPGEIQNAFDAGATCVKVFPAKALGGPTYFKELRGPFHDIPLLACGGVDTKNVAEYFQSGADAVAFGASIFRKEWLESGEFHKITDAIQDLRESAQR